MAAGVLTAIIATAAPASRAADPSQTVYTPKQPGPAVMVISGASMNLQGELDRYQK